MYTGYLELGGVELANTERVRGYAATANCPVNWLRGESCGTLAESLNDAPYDASNISEAPWFDPTQEDVSSRFYGVAAIDLVNRHDSTRSLAVTQAIRDGGVLGDVRHGTKEIQVRAVLLASGEDALSYGLDWLNSRLEPGACGQHGDACGFADLAFYTTCPPPMTYDWVSTPREVLATNLFTNPNLVGDGTWSAVRRNLMVTPNPSENLARYISHPSVTATAGPGYVDLEFTADVESGVTTTLLRPSATGTSGPIAVGELVHGGMRVENIGAVPVTLRVGLLRSTVATIPIVLSSNFQVMPDDVVDVRTPQRTVAADDTGFRTSLNLATAGNTIPAGAKIRVYDGITVEAVNGSMVSSATTPLHGGQEAGAVDIDMRSRWEGAPNDSPTVLEIENVREIVTSNCVAGVSSVGTKPAVRVISLVSASEVGYRSWFTIPTAAREAGTLKATRYLDGDGLGGEAFSRTLAAGDLLRGIGRNDTSSPLSLTHRWGGESSNPALTTTYRAYLYGDGPVRAGSGDVRWTDVGLFAGYYDGDVFSGSTVSEEEHGPIGYRWTGAPNASTSEMFRQTWESFINRERYAELLRPIERFMHDVGVTSGLSVRERYETSSDPTGPKGALVEFTITSERGYVYSRPAPVSLLTSADAYEDVQRNLFLNPTTDYAGPTALIRTNHCTNPSLETNDTGWTISGQLIDGTNRPSVAVTGGRVSSELRASGLYSMKAVTTEDATRLTEAIITWESINAGVVGTWCTLGIWGAVADPNNTVTRLRAEYRMSASGPWLPLAEAPSVASAKSGFTYRFPDKVEITNPRIGIRFIATGKKAFTAYADACMIIEG